MTSSYSGNPDNVITPLIRSIVDCSDSGGLILVQTSIPHLFADHDVVIVSGVVGTTEANGTWSVTVVSADTFTLDTSTFTNAYVSGGTATDTSLTPFFQVPDDGEFGTVASILAAITNLADRTQFLWQNEQAANVHTEVFDTPGAFSFTTGPTTTFVVVEGIGGGGGGGGGSGGDSGGGINGNSGSGGDGAQGYTRSVPVSPSTLYTGTIGTGGAFGTGSVVDGGAGGDGSAGTDTVLDGFLTFPGASFGAGGTAPGGGASTDGDSAPGGGAVGAGAGGGGGSGWAAGNGGDTGANGTSGVAGGLGGDGVAGSGGGGGGRGFGPATSSAGGDGGTGGHGRLRVTWWE